MNLSTDSMSENKEAAVDLNHSRIDAGSLVHSDRERGRRPEKTNKNRSRKDA